jgi:putative nucleotidyltransferase with HDIG domain
MTRDEAYQLVTDWTKNTNLVKHMLAVEAIMRALARHFHEDEALWGMAGLLHDADYEMFKDDPKKHPSKIFDELEKRNVDRTIINAIKSHAWGWKEELPEPQTKMEWSLYCCDDLSGFIIACALVRPDKKLESLTAESILKKWPQKSFASGVKREHVELCADKLGIPFEEFVRIALTAMQDIHDGLGL